MCQVQAISANESRLTGGGVIGNERLTSVNGVLLVALLAALRVAFQACATFRSYLTTLNRP